MTHAVWFVARFKYIIEKMAGFKPLFIVSAWPKYVPQDSKYNKRKKEKNDDKNGFALFKVTTKPKVKVFDDESIMFQF